MFPRGLGKGFDAALIGSWLGDLLGESDASTVPATQLL